MWQRTVHEGPIGAALEEVQRVHGDEKVDVPVAIVIEGNLWAKKAEAPIGGRFYCYV